MPIDLLRTVLPISAAQQMEMHSWGRVYEMARCISPKPTWFADEKERDYWHMAQDIAYRVGVSLVERDGSLWLITDGDERLVCERPERIWFETWRMLHSEYPELSRLWVGGRPITKPGE